MNVKFITKSKECILIVFKLSTSQLLLKPYQRLTEYKFIFTWSTYMKIAGVQNLSYACIFSEKINFYDYNNLYSLYHMSSKTNGSTLNMIFWYFRIMDQEVQETGDGLSKVTISQDTKGSLTCIMCIIYLSIIATSGFKLFNLCFPQCNLASSIFKISIQYFQTVLSEIRKQIDFF